MISDHDLLLYYYRDGLDAAERARIAAALSGQPELAARLHRLVTRLDAAADTPEVAVPEHVQQRWQAALEQIARGESAPGTTASKPRTEILAGFRWRIAAAACAVVLLMSVRVAMSPAPDRVAEQVAPVQIPVDGSVNDSSAYERGLRLHLADTEWQLANLENASGEERIRLIETISAQNRLYAIAAERAGEPQLARVLRAFAPVLERLAADRSSESAGEIERLNFELNVMQARLAAETSNRSTSNRSTSNRSRAQSLAL